MQAAHLQVEKLQSFRISTPQAITTLQAFASELSKEIASSMVKEPDQVILSSACRALACTQTVTALHEKLYLKKPVLKLMILFQS